MTYNLNKEFYSIREAAKFLSIRPKIVEALCLAGELEFIKDKNGKPIRIARASIQARARQNAEEAQKLKEQILKAAKSKKEKQA